MATTAEDPSRDERGASHEGEGDAPVTRVSVQTRLVNDDSGAASERAGEASEPGVDNPGEADVDIKPDGTVNPLEIVLTALGASQEITYRHFAKRLGIALRKVSITLHGDIDVRDGNFPTLQGIETHVTLHSSAPPAELEKLVNAVASHCPILNLCTKGTNVKMYLRHQAVEVV